MRTNLSVGLAYSEKAFALYERYNKRFVDFLQVSLSDCILLSPSVGFCMLKLNFL
jgi:hypothetical protein